jgi:DNA-binding GntR family transcriptional regulator
MTVAPPRQSLLLSDQLYVSLREMIVKGELAPNAQLQEAELCARFRVSRTPLRRAFQRLSDEGLVTVYPQMGSFVAPISAAAVREAQFVREHLECAVMVELVGRVDAAGLAEIEDCLDRQRRACARGDRDAFAELDDTLHALFATHAGRAGVWRIIHRNKVHLDRMRRRSLPEERQIPHLIEDHAAIVAAIAARDAEAAVTALRRHLREILGMLERYEAILEREAQPPRPTRAGAA